MDLLLIIMLTIHFPIEAAGRREEGDVVHIPRGVLALNTFLYLYFKTHDRIMHP